MRLIKRFWPFISLGVIVLIFFYQIFLGKIPFPGDLLANTNPYSAESLEGYSPGGYPNKAQGMDVISEIYPWRFFSVDQIKQSVLPFWNPHNFSGNPQVANFQTGIFYPLNFFYFILPFNISWTLIIMLQPFLAGIFMFLFLKKGIGLKSFPSLIGSIAFSFSSYMIVWIEYGNIGHTILWLPLILLLTKLIAEKPTVKNILAMIVSFSIAILAGYIQGIFYILILSFFYYLYLTYLNRSTIQYKKHLIFAFSIILPFLLTSFQILPTLSLFLQSTRGAYSLEQIEKNLVPIYYWITILFPDFFGNPATRNYWIDGTYIERVMYPGVAIIFFVIITLVSKIKIPEKKFFISVSIISLLIASNLPLVKFFYLIPIPVISTTIPTRELSILIFSLIVLGAIGVNHFFNDRSVNKKGTIIYGFIFILTWILVFALLKTNPDLSGNLKITLRNMIFPSILAITTILSIYLKHKSIKFYKILIVLILVADLFYFFNKITPFSPPGLIYPQTPIVSYLQKNAGIYRFWGYGSAYISPNFQSVDKTYSPEGNDPLHISRYGELLSSSANGKIPKVLPRPDANVAPGYGSDELKSNYYRQRVLNLLGVKYIVHKQEIVDAWNQTDLSTFPKEKFNLVKKIYPWQVYENKSALPRYFMAADYLLAKDKHQALSFIYNRNIDLSKTVVLEKSPNIPLIKNLKASVELKSYKSDRVLFRTIANGNAILFLSDNFYPEWSVKIDGIEKEILLADYSFRAVSVPGGTHTVEFYYNPKNFSIGLGVSAFGAIIAFLILFYVKNNQAKI